MEQFSCIIRKHKRKKKGELSETEKDYDRRTAMETLKLIQKIGFGIKKVKN